MDSRNLCRKARRIDRKFPEKITKKNYQKFLPYKNDVEKNVEKGKREMRKQKTNNEKKEQQW